MAARTPLVFTAAGRAALAHDRYHHPCPRGQQRMTVLSLLYFTRPGVRHSRTPGN